jgi:hypothetical protein
MKRAAFLSFLLLILASGHLLHGQENYWVPADPPKSHYRIDARVDPQKGFIEGKETVTLKNHSDRTIGVLAFDWTLSENSSIDITAEGKKLTLINTKQGKWPESPLFYRLPEPASPGAQIQLDITFKKSFEVSEEDSDFRSVQWYPRIWWDGLPVHDSFSVKLDIPEGYALAISGRLNRATGRYEIDGARTFGVCLGKGNRTESREVDGRSHHNTLHRKRCSSCICLFGYCCRLRQILQGLAGFLSLQIPVYHPRRQGTLGRLSFCNRNRCHPR